jgi:dUTPase
LKINTGFYGEIISVASMTAEKKVFIINGTVPQNEEALFSVKLVNFLASACNIETGDKLAHLRLFRKVELALEVVQNPESIRYSYQILSLISLSVCTVRSFY